MKKKESFSVRARGRSFKYAVEGMIKFFSSEHNAILHLLATGAVILLAVLKHVARSEIVLLVFATGIVWIAELLNTAVEKIMDFVSLKKHPEIKFIKDISAAAVLVAALVAFITGCIVFIPKF